MIQLNETPVRTSQNFHINNVKIEATVVPKVFSRFENVKIKEEGTNCQVSNNATSISESSLTYGISKDFETMVKENANQKIHIDFSSNQNNVTIEFGFNKENDALLDEIEVCTHSNAKGNLVIKYTREDDGAYFHNGILKILAEENTTLHVTIINFLSKTSNHFMSIQNELAENSQVTYTIVDFGGKHSVTNYFSNLLGDSSVNDIKTIYLGTDEQLFDLNYIGELRGKKSVINIDVQGALKDSAKKHFKGTIDFKKGAKKAKGDENEFCMLLSPKAKSLALPMLLCSEEDVEGNHASSAGKIGEKELFYIMSRGFELKEAMKLMVRARFNHIISEIENETIREEILEEIDRRLD